jgi:hypothetical protein
MLLVAARCSIEFSLPRSPATTDYGCPASFEDAKLAEDASPADDASFASEDTTN